MHDLNDALDELRHVIPYAHSPSVRKLSKIATLLLAKNYILMQTNALNELKRVLICLQQHHSGSELPQNLSASIATLLGTSSQDATKQLVQQARDEHDCRSPGGATSTNQGTSNSANYLLGSSGGGATISPAQTAMAPIKTEQQTNGGVGGGGSTASGDTNQTRGLQEESTNLQQQTLSVQYRRRKYSMLINRILGDVAAQQHQLMACIEPARNFVMPSGAPSQQQQPPPTQRTGATYTPPTSSLAGLVNSSIAANYQQNANNGPLDFCQSCDQESQPTTTAAIGQARAGFFSNARSVAVKRKWTSGESAESQSQSIRRARFRRASSPSAGDASLSCDDCSSPLSVGSPTSLFCGDHQPGGQSFNGNEDDGPRDATGTYGDISRADGNSSLCIVQERRHQLHSNARQRDRGGAADDADDVCPPGKEKDLEEGRERSHSASTIISFDDANGEERGEEEEAASDDDANDWPRQRRAAKQCR